MWTMWSSELTHCGLCMYDSSRLKGSDRQAIIGDDLYLLRTAVPFCQDVAALQQLSSALYQRSQHKVDKARVKHAVRAFLPSYHDGFHAAP